MSVTEVLVVEDDDGMASLIQDCLEEAGFTVLVSHDGLHALDLMHAHQPDLVTLDLWLPGLDGVEVLQRMRQFSTAYVLVLSGRVRAADKVDALNRGADDYVTKPFTCPELVARINALLRRPRSLSSDTGRAPRVHQFNELMIDEERHEVTIDGALVTLTAREFQLLTLLATQPERVFERGHILTQLWGHDHYDTHVVDVHVGNLRKKIEQDPADPRYVQTVRGIGYRFNP